MATLHFPTKEPFVDLKTGKLTKKWEAFLENLNVSLAGLDFSNISGVLALAQLVEHQDTHKGGGSDALKLDELATPNDNTDLDATAGHHGLLPKLSGNVLHTLKGNGTWS